MAPKYKFLYFAIRARGEPIRWALHYKNIPFEDVSVGFEEWGTTKERMPWGALPVLEVDGKQLSQSGTILRYLGRAHGLAGKSDWEAAKCDEYIDALEDILPELGKMMKEKDEAKKAEAKKNLQEVVIPRVWGKFDKILKDNGTGFLVGSDVTIADMKLAAFVEWLSDRLGCGQDAKFPQLNAHLKKIMGLPGIKEWLVRRPPPAF